MTSRTDRIAHLQAQLKEQSDHPYREDAGAADQLATELDDLQRRICETCQDDFVGEHPDNGCPASGKNVEHPYLWADR